jgi:hypothetical protein
VPPLSLLTLADLVELAEHGVGSSADWADVFACGTHRAGEPAWTPRDLDAVCRNFSANPQLVPSVGLGHEDDQSWVEDSGYPAAGRVSALRRDPDRPDVLQARFSDMPLLVTKAIERGLYYTCSAELYDEPPPGCSGSGPMLRRVSLLGFDIPAVKRLRPLPGVRYAEPRPARRRTRHVRTLRRPGRCQVFSEVRMATDTAVPGDDAPAADAPASAKPADALLAVVKAAHPDLDEAFLDSLSPAQLAMLANAHAANLGDAKPADPADPAAYSSLPAAQNSALWAKVDDAGEKATDKEGNSRYAPSAMKGKWAEHAEGDMTKAAMIDRLVKERGGDRTWLEQADESVVKGIYQMAFGREGKPVASATYAELQAVRSEIAGLKRDAAQIKAAQEREAAESRRRAQADRLASVRSYCERWQAEGYVTPAEVDPNAKAPNLYLRLMQADGTRLKTFGERSLSDFDAAVAEVESRGAGYVRRVFREQIGTDVTGAPGGRGDLAEVDAAARKTATAYAERMNKVRRGAGVANGAPAAN